MLMSWVNMKLRDQYSSFDLLCDDLDLDRAEVEKRLNDAGFEYLPQANQFR